MKDKILKTELLEWRELIPFQPDILKSQTVEQHNKLKKSLIKNGFTAAFQVWGKGKKFYILDGHSRYFALKELADEGAQIPEKLPCTFIDIKNAQQAKKAVLLFNSHYAKIEKSALAEFTADFDLDDLIGEIDIPDIDMDDLGDVPPDFPEESGADRAEPIPAKLCKNCGEPVE